MTDQKQQAHEFLSALWEGIPEGHKFLTWSLDRKYSLFWKAEEIESAADAVAGKPNEYVGVGVTDQKIPIDKRAKAADISGIAGLALDIDYEDGSAHKARKDKFPLPPDEAAAMQLLDAMPLKPTIVVHSGHGLQAWWLFKEVMTFDRPIERTTAAEISRRWNATLAAKAHAFGWSVDSVHDLARVMRIPGTVNKKADSPSVPARLLVKDGPRYSDLDVIDEVCIEISPEEATKAAAGLKLNEQPRGWDYWQETIRGVAQGERDNRITSLNGKILSMLDDVDNEENCRFALHMVLAVNARFQPPLPEEDVRRSFFSILQAERSRRNAIREAEIFESSELLADEAPLSARMDVIAKILSPDPLPLAKVIKTGRSGSEWLFELSNGDQFPVGPLLNQDGVRKAIMDFTGGTAAPVMLRTFKKAEWTEKVVRRLMAVATEVIAPEMERTGAVGDYLLSYLGRKVGENASLRSDADWHLALPDGEPFVLANELHINVDSMLSAMKISGHTIDNRNLLLGLRQAGMTIRKMSHTPPNGSGRRIQKRYWAGPVSSLEQIASGISEICAPAPKGTARDTKNGSGDTQGTAGDTQGTAGDT